MRDPIGARSGDQSRRKRRTNNWLRCVSCGQANKIDIQCVLQRLFCQNTNEATCPKIKACGTFYFLYRCDCVSIIKQWLRLAEVILRVYINTHQRCVDEFCNKCIYQLGEHTACGITLIYIMAIPHACAYSPDWYFIKGFFGQGNHICWWNLVSYKPCRMFVISEWYLNRMIYWSCWRFKAYR